jgi:hypothetical protein
VQAAFNASVAALKRLEASAKAPVFSLFSQTVDGLDTIRPMQLTAGLDAAMGAAIDASTAAYLSWAHLNRCRVRLLAAAAGACCC